MTQRLLFVLFLIFSPVVNAGDFVLAFGSSITSEQPYSSLGEYLNRSNAYSLRYEGEHYGVRIDHSVGGDDAGNTYATGDALFKGANVVGPEWPLHYLIAGAGIMVNTQPLRGVGSRMNFHAMVGVEHDRLFGRLGVGLWFDHWSNGHIHALFGPDNVANPPRNVLSLGVIVPLEN